ncbi:MAG: hypothetical protein K2F81_08075, partial [Ruminococcus sp.]|nr:hypothetical protein [Ruminococcus sp.]
MFLILPVTYEVESPLSPKKAARKLDHELIEHRPTLNIMSNGRFMRSHRFETCFYGCRTGQFKFQLYHHMAKKRDGGATGFFGKIEQTENGSVIKGSFRKPVYTYVIAVLWTIITLFLSLMLFAVKEKIGALCVLGVFVLGIVIMFWDNKKPLLKA